MEVFHIDFQKSCEHIGYMWRNPFVVSTLTRPSSDSFCLKAGKTQQLLWKSLVLSGFNKICW